jgi:hypothetical protein
MSLIDEEILADTPCDQGGWAPCSKGCLRLHNMGDACYIGRPDDEECCRPGLEQYRAKMRRLAERRWH